ncbi:MAG: hypothetical protein IKT00_11150 [Prevotella sp.]|nr:hypothetical protein [Prevotella sp.]
MGYVLRFIGAILATVVFAMIAVLFHFLFFGGAAHFFANISWHSLFSFDSLRGLLLPLAWTIMWLVAMGAKWIVKGNIWLAVIPILICILGLIHGFDILFLHPYEVIISDIGHGFWYYLGAILTYIGMIVFFAIFGFFILSKEGI